MAKAAPSTITPKFHLFLAQGQVPEQPLQLAHQAEARYTPLHTAVDSVYRDRSCTLPLKPLSAAPLAHCFSRHWRVCRGHACVEEGKDMMLVNDVQKGRQSTPLRAVCIRKFSPGKKSENMYQISEYIFAVPFTSENSWREVQIQRSTTSSSYREPPVPNIRPHPKPQCFYYR